MTLQMFLDCTSKHLLPLIILSRAKGIYSLATSGRLKVLQLHHSYTTPKRNKKEKAMRPLYINYLNTKLDNTFIRLLKNQKQKLAFDPYRSSSGWAPLWFGWGKKKTMKSPAPLVKNECGNGGCQFKSGVQVSNSTPLYFKNT